MGDGRGGDADPVLQDGRVADVAVELGEQRRSHGNPGPAGDPAAQ